MLLQHMCPVVDPDVVGAAVPATQAHVRPPPLPLVLVYYLLCQMLYSLCRMGALYSAVVFHGPSESGFKGWYLEVCLLQGS